MIYPNFKDMLMRGEVNLIKDKLWCVLSSSSYNSTDTRVIDINISSKPQILQNKTLIGGVFDASDVIFGGVELNTIIKSVIIYTDKDNMLVACIENISGMPFDNTLKNNNIIAVNWNNFQNKIMSI